MSIINTTQARMQKALFIILFFILATAGTGIVLYHQYFNYDIATIFHNPNLTFAQDKTQTVSSLAKIHHVFVIVLENHDWKDIYKSTSAPYINTVLLPHAAFATDYHNVLKNLPELHPSEPSYVLLEAGKISFADHMFTNDDQPNSVNSTSSTNHLSTLLEKNSLSWKSYQEDISGTNCPIFAEKNYVPKHNPFVFFQDVSGNPPSGNTIYCQTHIRPLTELEGDLDSGNLTNYIFITPNLQHDMHDGSINQADAWLATIVPMIENATAFKQDGALFITWDEGYGDAEENNPIGMIISSPFVKKGYTNDISYSHASYVKTVQEIFTLSPLVGFAADTQTQDLTDFFNN